MRLLLLSMLAALPLLACSPSSGSGSESPGGTEKPDVSGAGGQAGRSPSSGGHDGGSSKETGSGGTEDGSNRGRGGSSGSVGNGGGGPIGGFTGSGGSSHTGGAANSGGSANAGGPNGSGGLTGSGGSNRTGGSATSDGSVGSGGSTGAGGATGTGTPGDVVAAGVRWMGRVDVSNPSQPVFSYSETGFVASFTGTGMTVDLSDGGDIYYTAVVDGTSAKAMIHGGAGNVTVTAASGLAEGTHTIEFYRQTESSQGVTTFKGLHVTGTLNPPPAGPGRLIEVIGDSISCGYGDLCSSNNSGFQEAKESAHDTWGAIAARTLGADVSIVARSGIGIYQDNTGSKTNTMPNVYGQTHYSPATPAWGFAPKPQAVVINLGTNDFASANPGKANYEGAMLSFVQAIRTHYPDAHIFLTIGPMVSDSYPAGAGAYTNSTTYLQNVVTQSKDPKVSYFGLEQQNSADYGCDYHPNVNRQKIMGEAAAAAIRAKLAW